MVDSELIKFKKVTKRFGKNLVLSSNTFDIPENKITGLIGSSGSGKTTVLKLIIGTYRPTKGEVVYLKKNIRKKRKDIEKYFGFSTEDGSFYSKLTVKENIHYFGRLQRMKKKDIYRNCEKLMKLVGLEYAKDTLAENLSIGMKKRLDISCALIHSPKVLIMDEPTSGLDPVLRKEIIKLIKVINKRGTTIILTTQLLGEADSLLDNVLMLYNRKIVENGSPKEINKRYKKDSINDVFEEIVKKHRISKKGGGRKIIKIKKSDRKRKYLDKEELDKILDEYEKKDKDKKE